MNNEFQRKIKIITEFSLRDWHIMTFKTQFKTLWKNGYKNSEIKFRNSYYRIKKSGLLINIE